MNDERLMTQLAALVNERRVAMGLSYAAIATEAGLSVATVHKIAAGRMQQVPSQRTIDGLSHALAISPQSLIEAAAADIGLREYNVSEGKRQMIMYAIEDLTDEDRDFVLAMINRLKSTRPIEAGAQTG